VSIDSTPIIVVNILLQSSGLLTNLENYCYKYCMAGRPPKDPALRMTADLRIPVTAAQKQIIADAMTLNGSEFAAWAREVLLTNAQAMLDVAKDRGRRKHR
jgi:hypothetical protein